MILNPGKCRYMCLRKSVDGSEELNFNDLNISNRKKITALDINIDKNLNSSTHLKIVKRSFETIFLFSMLKSYCPFFDLLWILAQDNPTI